MAQTIEEKREAARLRQIKSRAKRRVSQPLAPSPVKTKPVERSFASFMKVKEVRRGSEPGMFFIDMTVGPYLWPGQHYVAQTGQLHWTSCRTQRLKPKLSKSFYVRTLRPMVIDAIGAFLTAEKGKPTSLPKAYLFPVTPRKPGLTRKPRKTKETVTE
jgi:hypothetical protein